MLDPHDDTDVPSGSTDGAQMESTSSPVPRLQPKLPHDPRLDLFLLPGAGSLVQWQVYYY